MEKFIRFLVVAGLALLGLSVVAFVLSFAYSVFTLTFAAALSVAFLVFGWRVSKTVGKDSNGFLRWLTFVFFVLALPLVWKLATFVIPAIAIIAVAFLIVPAVYKLAKTFKRS